MQAVDKHGYSWIVHATWDGALGICWASGVGRSSPQAIVRDALQPAWNAADALLGGLGSQGLRYLHLLVNQGAYVHGPDYFEAMRRGPVERGPLRAGVDPDVLASIERELWRSGGSMAYEP